jgi:YHS domain-containing protein
VADHADECLPKRVGALLLIVMEVDTNATDLKVEHDGTTYWFCGRGCLLEFRDDPAHYLDPDYQPSM